MPSSCMIEGTFIDGASFDVVQSDGRSGACQFETIAAAQGDGTSAEGLRAAASAFILRRPNARVQYGARLISIAELTEQLAGLSSRDYALKLSKCGVWGDGASFAVACHIDGLRGHVLLPCGRDNLVIALACGPRDGRPLFAQCDSTRTQCGHRESPAVVSLAYDALPDGATLFTLRSERAADPFRLSLLFERVEDQHALLRIDSAMLEYHDFLVIVVLVRFLCCDLELVLLRELERLPEVRRRRLVSR